jgi:tetratricopeptide (TPR) repeat protein
MTPPPRRAQNPLLKWVRQAVSEGDYATAEKVSRQSLQESARNPEMLNLRGLALGKLKRYEEAFAVHAEAVTLVADNSVFWHNYGVTLSDFSTMHRDTESANKAIDAFVNAISLDETQFPSYAGLVAHYMEIVMKGEPRARGEIEGKADEVVDRLFRVAVDVEMPLSVSGLDCSDRVYLLTEELNFAVLKRNERIFCEHDSLDIYGEGASFTEAWRALCEHFDVLYREYVESGDPLHESALLLANTLQDLVQAYESPPGGQATQVLP